MRIISGFAKGIPLKVAPRGVRPTTDRVKESLFNIIGDLQNKRVIDLFSGSGSLGLEALSRGAKEVYFFENNKRSCLIIQDNLTKILKSQYTNNIKDVKIFPLNYSQVTKLVTGKFDYIFADPPYQGNFVGKLLQNSSLFNLLTVKGWFILEHPKSLMVDEQNLEDIKIIKQKNFGITRFSFIQKK